VLGSTVKEQSSSHFCNAEASYVFQGAPHAANEFLGIGKRDIFLPCSCPIRSINEDVQLMTVSVRTSASFSVAQVFVLEISLDRIA
jgi:hypothetical protein